MLVLRLREMARVASPSLPTPHLITCTPTNFSGVNPGSRRQMIAGTPLNLSEHLLGVDPLRLAGYP